MDSPTETHFATWSAPECPFAIVYSLRVLDDIRLAVMDAFFSLPRGGAEIGGILLGTVEKNRLLIMDYAALDCEHAFGPSFTLSDRDYAKLEELLVIARRSGAGLAPVGWYHSHTRSEVFFSDADIAIHKRFFPEPWQVGLVLKPHTFEPTRAGFFFRQTGGVIHGESCYREFTLDPQAMQPAVLTSPGPIPAITQSTAITLPPQAASGPAETAPVAPEPVPIPIFDSKPEPADVAPVDLKPPDFLAVQQPSRRWWRWALAGLAAAGVAAGGFQTRNMWLPPLRSAFVRSQPAPAPKPPEAPINLGLTASDQGGQLHIAWDGRSPAVRNGATGVLSISEGAAPLTIPLDEAHLQTGSFTFGREGTRVDISLTVQGPGGKTLREATTFVGPLPQGASPAEDPAARKQRDDLAKEAAQLKSDLKKQAERTKQLENSVDQMRLELIRQQRARMQNMSTDAPKVPAKKQ